MFNKLMLNCLQENFNGVPVVNDSDSVVGIVTAIDVLKAIREGKKLVYSW